MNSRLLPPYSGIKTGPQCLLTNPDSTSAMKFEWDAKKNRTNISKHNVSFEDTCYVLAILTH